MNNFIAMETHAGTLVWQSPYLGDEGEEDKQQGVQFGFRTLSLHSEGAFSYLRGLLKDLGEGWIHPLGSPSGSWVVHLDMLPKRFPSLEAQKWLSGERLVKPEFDIIESWFGSRSQKTGIVRFTLFPEGGDKGRAANVRKIRAFLCHASSDKERVRELHRRMVEDGFEPWLDEVNLLPGQDWKLEISRAVRESNVVLVCLSQSSVSKTGFVQREITFALDRAEEYPEGTIYLIPVRLEACKVPDRLQKWQWVDLFLDSGYPQLKESLLRCS